MEHEECHLLLPAYLHGKLNTDQQLAVQQHVARCTLCFDAQQEAEFLKSHISETPRELEEIVTSSAMQRNLDKTLNAIDHMGVAQFNKAAKKPFLKEWFKNIHQQWDITPFGFKGLMVGQFASIVAVLGLVTLLLTQPEQNLNPADVKTYQTLSDNNSTAVASNNALEYQVYRVVFHSAATEKDIRTLLNTVEGQIISGPSVSGVYTVAIIKNEQQNSLILNSLRQSPWTKLAEPAVNKDKLASPAY